MQNGEPDEGFDVHIVWMRGQRIDEEENGIDLLLCRQSANLLIPAEWTRQKPRDAERVRGFLKPSARGARAEKL